MFTGFAAASGYAAMIWGAMTLSYVHNAGWMGRNLTVVAIDQGLELAGIAIQAAVITILTK